LCGLRYSDIDIENRCVTISRTVERIADLSIGATARTKVVIGEPKTQASARVIPLPSFLVGILEENATDPSYYLLTGTEKYTEPHQFYMRYKTFMRRLGLEQYTFHALRHTFATRCIDNGFDAKALSEILGHSNVSTTLSLYVHPTLEQKRRQMERLSPSMYL
jgi:integrase